MQYIFLSYPMSKGTPRPPAIPEPEVSEFMTVEKDGASVDRITFYNHTGTHLDTEAHVISGGVSIGCFTPEDLVFGNITVVSLDRPDCHHITPADLEPHSARLAGCDMAVIRFDLGEIRACDHYRFSNMMPGFTAGAAAWLRGRCPGLRCLGTDLPSFSVISDLGATMGAHNVFLRGSGSKMLIIEEMKLDIVPAALPEVIISPWFIEGVNSGPCTVIARIGAGDSAAGLNLNLT